MHHLLRGNSQGGIWPRRGQVWETHPTLCVMRQRAPHWVFLFCSLAGPKSHTLVRMKTEMAVSTGLPVWSGRFK